MRVEEMGDSVFSPAIAAAMAKLHRFPVPPELKQHYAKPGMWDQLWLWYRQAAAEETSAKITARSEADAAQLADIDLVRVRVFLLHVALEPRCLATACRHRTAVSTRTFTPAVDTFDAWPRAG